MTSGRKIELAHPLFDALLSTYNFSSDKELAFEIGVWPSSISKVRHGRTELSNDIRIAIMRRFKWSLEKLDQLAPPKD